MQTLRQAISDMVNDLKSYNLDDRFSFKFLASKLRSNIELFLKQDADSRRILSTNKIWKPLKCIKLKDADYDACSEFYDVCTVLKRSRNKIPEVYTSSYGDFIKILNLNNSIEYKQIKSFQYKDIKNREYTSKKTKYFWIEEGYLYMPDVEIEEVKGLGLFKDSQEADLFNGDVDCCYKPLDSELLVPDYILDIAKKQVVQDLLQSNKALVADERPNLNSNAKN